MVIIVPPPVAPKLSVPTRNTTGRFSVTWGALAHVTHYQLQERRDGISSLIHDGRERSKALAGKRSGAWGYRVRGCNRAGCGPYSAQAAVRVLRTPDVPSITLSTKLQTSHSPIKIACSVSWTPIAYASRYQLYAYANGQLYQQQYDGPNTSAGGLWLNNQPPYSKQCATGHVVRACNATGCSAWSAPVTQRVDIIPTDPGSGIPIRFRKQP